MRRVTNWNEVNDALRELFNFKDTQLNSNLDFHQRQIKNAHPSIDDYDYVVRKELRNFIDEPETGNVNKKPTTAVKTYDKVTFGLGIGAPISVGSDATPPFIWSNSAIGKPEIFFAAANLPPTDQDALFDIKHNGVSIFTAGFFTFPASTSPKSVITPGPMKSNLTLQRRDVLTIDVIQTGSTFAGEGFQFVVFCKLI